MIDWIKDNCDWLIAVPLAFGYLIGCGFAAFKIGWWMEARVSPGTDLSLFVVFLMAVIAVGVAQAINGIVNLIAWLKKKRRRR